MVEDEKKQNVEPSEPAEGKNEPAASQPGKYPFTIVEADEDNDLQIALFGLPVLEKKSKKRGRKKKG